MINTKKKWIQFKYSPTSSADYTSHSEVFKEQEGIFEETFEAEHYD